MVAAERASPHVWGTRGQDGHVNGVWGGYQAAVATVFPQGVRGDAAIATATAPLSLTLLAHPSASAGAGPSPSPRPSPRVLPSAVTAVVHGPNTARSANTGPCATHPCCSTTGPRSRSPSPCPCPCSCSCSPCSCSPGPGRSREKVNHVL